MKMSEEIVNNNCVSVIKCLFSSCCSIEKFQREMTLLNLFSAITFCVISVFIALKITIYNKNRLQKNNDNVVNNTGHRITLPNKIGLQTVKSNQNESHTNNYYFVILNILLKFLILQTFLFKLIEISFMQNYFIVGDIERFSLENIIKTESPQISDSFVILTTIRLLIEFFLLFLCLAIFYVAGQFLEFYKKYIIVLIISFFLLHNNIQIYLSKSVILYNSYLITAVVLLIIILISIQTLIYANSIFFTKLNRDHNITEKNLNQDIMESYSLSKISEDNISLYRETKRVFDMYKVLEIVENIRINRKQVMNVGLTFMFALLGISIILSIIIFFENFKISHISYQNNYKINELADISNLDYLMDRRIKEMKRNSIQQRINKKNYPKSVLLVMISNIDNDVLEENSEYIDFIDNITMKEKTGRVYSVTPHSNTKENIPYWISYFTGAKMDLTGVKGNLLNSSEINKLDSIFKKMKVDRLASSFVCSPGMIEFLQYSIPDVNIIQDETYFSKNSILSKMEKANDVKYLDEKIFQNAMEVVQSEKENYSARIKELDKQKDSIKDKENLDNRNYQFNTLTVVHFSNYIFLIFKGELNYISKKYSIEEKTKRDILIQSGISSKLHYVKSLYNEIDENTVMLILSDSPYKLNSKLPLIAIRKNSNFADNEFSLYSKKKTPDFEPSDIASTLSALLSVNIPLHNQGRFIDEIIQLTDYTEQERKLIYLDLRQQQQKISLKFLDYFSESSGESFSKEVREIDINYRPPENTDVEYYDNEIRNFNKLVNHVYGEIYSREVSKNLIYSASILIGVIFLIMIVIQSVTYADIVSILFLNSSGKRNGISLILAITGFIAYYGACRILILTFSQNNLYSGQISDFYFALQYISVFIIIPFLIAIRLQKFIFSVMFYANSIQSSVNENSKPMGFFVFNLIRDIGSAVLVDDGLAFVYLFRIYSVLISISMSMVFFYQCNGHSFTFSSAKLSSMLIYNNDNFQSLKFDNSNFLLVIVYQFICLIHLYNYPAFSKNKQIFDSIFILSDLKLGDDDEIKTCERQAFQSSFVKVFINFDTQSEYYYRYRHFMESDFYPKLSEKFCSSLILWKILNSKYDLTKIENDIKKEEEMLGKENVIINQFKRTSFDNR